PHSEICGSKDACSSPQLIAACHVLHRLEVPRHPPCALSSLTIKFTHEQQTLLQFEILNFKISNQGRSPSHLRTLSHLLSSLIALAQFFKTCLVCVSLLSDTTLLNL